MATGKWKSFEADWNWQSWYEAVLISENRPMPHWLQSQNVQLGATDDIAITTPPTVPAPNTFKVGGFWQPCFDGYTPMECVAILKQYRLATETNQEAYERIKSAGVANCTPPQKASPEFVKALFAKGATA